MYESSLSIHIYLLFKLFDTVAQQEATEGY